MANTTVFNGNAVVVNVDDDPPPSYSSIMMTPPTTGTTAQVPTSMTTIATQTTPS